MGLIWDTIISVFGLVVAIAIAVAGRLLSDDAKEWLPWITRHLIERAVARLPENEREKRREEWNSDVNEWPGNLAKVYRVWGYLSAARAIRHMVLSGETPHIRTHNLPRLSLVLLFLGLSLSAVATMRVDREPGYLTADDGITRLTADDGVTLLTTGRQQYQLVIGGVRIPLPVWTR
jgi:hypothetical protein